MITHDFPAAQTEARCHCKRKKKIDKNKRQKQTIRNTQECCESSGSDTANCDVDSLGSARYLVYIHKLMLFCSRHCVRIEQPF